MKKKLILILSILNLLATIVAVINALCDLKLKKFAVCMMIVGCVMAFSLDMYLKNVDKLLEK